MPDLQGRRLFVLGLDGLAHSFIGSCFRKGELRALESITKDGMLKRMCSSYPAVSSVAWTSYMTGANPGVHGIFGFIDRDPAPFSLKIPTGRERRAPTLWRKLSDAGRRVIVINVPLTYPPEEVNGILIADFLCTDIEKVAYPSSVGAYLKSKGYIIDADAWLARESRDAFADQIMLALDKRFEVTFGLIDKESWDFFQLHIMETDRLFHFFYSDLESGPYNGFVKDFFKRLDGYIARLREKLSRNDSFIVLSDHGFCGIKSEVQLNAWLEKEGLLKFGRQSEKKLEDYDPATIAYSLIPGRIYVNMIGREENGSVASEDRFKRMADIKERLLGMKDDTTGEKVIDRVFYREEIYDGPRISAAADIIAHPKDGYDLKARVDSEKVFTKTNLSGMHTYDDAFIGSVNCDIGNIESIQDVSREILRLY